MTRSVRLRLELRTKTGLRAFGADGGFGGGQVRILTVGSLMALPVRNLRK
jgi:hypothetical protein